MDAIVRSEEEINEQLNKAQEFVDGGGSPFFGMTYEEGIIEMHRWLTGLSDEKPME